MSNEYATRADERTAGFRILTGQLNEYVVRADFRPRGTITPEPTTLGNLQNNEGVVKSLLIIPIPQEFTIRYYGNAYITYFFSKTQLYSTPMDITDIPIMNGDNTIPIPFELYDGRLGYEGDYVYFYGDFFGSIILIKQFRVTVGMVVDV